MGKGGENPSVPTKRTKDKPADDFYWSATDEPHASRRKLILAKYPEIKQLYGHCWQLKYKVICCMLLQGIAAYTFRNQFDSTGSATSDAEAASSSSLKLPWWQFWVTAYVIGGTCNHMLMMALHELSHNLGFKQIRHNRWFAVFANIPVAVPSAVTFKRYHMDHHKYQGVDGIDVDIPTFAEGHFFNTTLRKLLFVIFQVAFYALRPSFVNPKKPGMAEAVNAVVVIGADLLVVYFWGISSLLYLLASSWLGMGLHPVAGHFIAEHYVFPRADGLVPETYSYYGPCNYLTFNVGYHNEHHDFPFVPGSRLPEVRRIAAEFYDPLPHHASYVRVMGEYIFCDAVTAFSRVKRAATAPDAGGVATDRDDEAAATAAKTATRAKAE